MNLTVEDGVVVDAVTDAEMISVDTPDSSCADAEPAIDDGEIIGAFDINGDGRDEVVALLDDGDDLASFAMWTWDDDCSFHRVTLGGVPAVLSAGLTGTTAAGVSCKETHVDDLYLIELASNDEGETYEGRIAAFDLRGTEIVEVSGEGAAFSSVDVSAIAVFNCGEITFP